MMITLYKPVYFYFLGTSGGPHEKRLLDHLFFSGNYSKYARPVAFEADPVDVKFGIILQQLIDVVSLTLLCIISFTKHKKSKNVQGA